MRLLEKGQMLTETERKSTNKSESTRLLHIKLETTVKVTDHVHDSLALQFQNMQLKANDKQDRPSLTFFLTSHFCFTAETTLGVYMTTEFSIWLNDLFKPA